MHREIRIRTAKTADQLPDELHPLLRQVYLNRGVGTAQELDLSLAGLLSYHSLKGMDAAIKLLVTAITKQQHILIVGDFDADGATSTALAISALGSMGAERVSYLVPDRFRFGYGLTPEIVAVALEQQPDLIITVDNGISSVAGVAAAQAAGVKVLVTDHHLPGRELPSADAIVNPNQAGCGFPSKKLAGVGVIFYVMAALRAELRALKQLPDPNWSMAELLDLVALGTVADVVPLDHNNRILVEQGLQRIRAGRSRPGIRAMIAVARREASRLSASDLGFAVGPRLNAAGRLQDMSMGIECLLASDDTQAGRLAQELDAINQERRDIQEQMQSEAVAMIDDLLKDENELPIGLCVFEAAWHEGVVGLVASKLKERHHRPCIAFAVAGDERMLKGSARSIPGLHIRDVLDRVAGLNPGLIDKFGGHAMAAGLSLPKERLDEFKAAFLAVLEESLDTESLSAAIESDGVINAEWLNTDLANLLDQGGPWGQSFPEPVFHGEFEVVDERVLKDKHLKLRLHASGIRQPIDGIAFNALEANQPHVSLTGRVELVYRLNVNEYMGRRSAQLMIEQIRPA